MKLFPLIHKRQIQFHNNKCIKNLGVTKSTYDLLSIVEKYCETEYDNIKLTDLN